MLTASLPSAGLRPLATCSPAHSALARHFGAEAVFDYRDGGAAAAIRVQAVLSHAMPPNNITAMPPEERQVLAAWLGR